MHIYARRLPLPTRVEVKRAVLAPFCDQNQSEFSSFTVLKGQYSLRVKGRLGKLGSFPELWFHAQVGDVTLCFSFL